MNASKDKLPPTGNVKTIAMNLSLAKLNAFQAAEGDASVLFYRFHILIDLHHRCGSLLVVVECDEMDLSKPKTARR